MTSLGLPEQGSTGQQLSPVKQPSSSGGSDSLLIVLLKIKNLFNQKRLTCYKSINYFMFVCLTAPP